MMENEGISLLNAYGLSETSSIISIEYPGENDEDSVGTVFENQEVRIDSPDENGIGEILVKGENKSKPLSEKSQKSMFAKFAKEGKNSVPPFS